MQTSTAQPDDMGSAAEARSRRTKKARFHQVSCTRSQSGHNIRSQGVLLSTIPKTQLEQLFHMPLEAAAEELGLGLTAMKTLCRQHNLSRWPYRKVQSLKRYQAMLLVRWTMAAVHTSLSATTQAGTCSEDDLFRVYQLVKSIGLPLDHPLWSSYMQVDMGAVRQQQMLHKTYHTHTHTQAIGEYARQHSVLSAAMRTTSEAPSPSSNSLCLDNVSGPHAARSGSAAAPASVIRIPVANAVSHLSGDMGAPSGGPLPPRLVSRKPSGAMMRIVSGAGYDEPSEVAEREGSAVEGSGDSPPRPAATERSDITGLQTTISRVSTLHPALLKMPKRPAVAATDVLGDGCECGCVSQPVVDKPAGAVGKTVLPMSAGDKCTQCGGLPRAVLVQHGGVAEAAPACGHGATAACGAASAAEEDKVVVDKGELLKLLGMVKELQAKKGSPVDVETWLEALKR